MAKFLKVIDMVDKSLPIFIGGVGLGGKIASLV